MGSARGGGINQVYQLISRRPGIKSQLTRLRDHQRVLCSDSIIISPWFYLVLNIKAKYGILDKDTYNFDKTGFQMGVRGSVKVVTASEWRIKPLGVQPGNCEWVTLCEVRVKCKEDIDKLIVLSSLRKRELLYTGSSSTCDFQKESCFQGSRYYGLYLSGYFWYPHLRILQGSAVSIVLGLSTVVTSYILRYKIS